MGCLISKIFGFFLLFEWPSSLLLELLPVSSATSSLDPGGPGGGWARWAVPTISYRHWVAVGCDLVDHGSILGVGAQRGHNYNKAHDGEEHDQHQLFSPGILEDSNESPGHLDHDWHLIM